MLLRGLRRESRGMIAGVLALGVWVGCGDDSGGGAEDPKPDASTPGDGDAGGDGDGDDAADGGEPGGFEEECTAACRAQAECFSLSESECASMCALQGEAIEGACEQASTLEQRCLGELSCAEAMTYATEGRREHSVCGEAAEEYFAACTYDGGQTPGACTELCGRYGACDIAQPSTAACEERCLLDTTNYDATSSDCSSAYLEFLTCVAGAECGDLEEFAASNLVPVDCEEALDAVDQACE